MTCFGASSVIFFRSKCKTLVRLEEPTSYRTCDASYVRCALVNSYPGGAVGKIGSALARRLWCLLMVESNMFLIPRYFSLITYRTYAKWLQRRAVRVLTSEESEQFHSRRKNSPAAKPCINAAAVRNTLDSRINKENITFETLHVGDPRFGYCNSFITLCTFSTMLHLWQVYVWYLMQVAPAAVIIEATTSRECPYVILLSFRL